MSHHEIERGRCRLSLIMAGLMIAVVGVLCLPSAIGVSARPADTSLYDDGQWVEMGKGSASGAGISAHSGYYRPLSLAIGPDNLPIVAWNDFVEAESGFPGEEIFLLRWNGQAWAEMGPGSATGGGISEYGGGYGQPSLAVAPDGKPIIAWSGPGREIFVRQWDGESWAQLGRGSVSGGELYDEFHFASSPSLAIAADGRPVVAWEDVEIIDPPTGLYDSDVFVRRWNGTAWVEVGPDSASGGGISEGSGNAVDPSLAIGPDDKPIVAYGQRGEIHVRRWNGVTWEELNSAPGTGGGISNNAGISRVPSLAVGADGMPVVAWQDSTDGDSEIYVRQWNGASWVEMGAGSAAGGGISDNEGLSAFPSLAISPDGTPIVAWDDLSRVVGEIYVRRWDGANWVEMGHRSATYGGVSKNPGTSRAPSLAIGPDGIAVIAWQDSSNVGDTLHTYVRRWFAQPAAHYELTVTLQKQAAAPDQDSTASRTTPPKALVHLPVIRSPAYFSPPLELEPNDTSQQANGPLFFDTIYYGSLADDADTSDYYTFRLLGQQRIRARLKDIPVGENFDLVLRDEAMQLIGQSANPGHVQEEIQLDLPSGWYYLQVTNHAGDVRSH